MAGGKTIIMAKLKLSETLKTYVGSGVLLTATGYVVVAGLNGVAWPWLVGFGVPSLAGGWGLAIRLYQLTAPDDGRTVRGGRAIPLHANGRDEGNIFMSSVKSIFGTHEVARTRPIIPTRDFWERGMESAIPEDMFFLFCKTAWRRQRNAEIGNAPMNVIFSRNYFTKEARPRYTKSDYESILWILSTRNLIYDRVQGKGGRLRYPPCTTLEQARLMW
jgi:hypothetical protein